MEWFFKSFFEPFLDIPTLKNLVFGKYREDSLVWGTFTAEELTEGLGPLFYTMAVLSGFFLVGLIVVYGMRIAGAPMNPGKRIEVIDFFKDLLIVSILLMNLDTIYDLLFQVNTSIVQLFSSAYENQAMDAMSEFDFDSGPVGELKSTVGKIFIFLILIGLMLWANFYYMMRKLTLIILMGLGPLMVVFWLHPKFKSMTGSWFKELVGSIFVQAIHALVFWMIVVVSDSQTGLVAQVILYVIFIPISESLRRLLDIGGDMQGGLAKAGSMMGMAGLAGMYGAAKGAIGDQSVGSALRNAYEGVKNRKDGKGQGGNSETDNLKATLASNAGGDHGATAKAENMLRAGDIIGRAGKATFGMAGAISGMGVSPVATMIGSTAGFEAGGVIGGAIGRTGASLGQGLASRFGKGIDASKQKLGKDNSQEFEEALAGDIADRETAKWADGHEDSMKSSLRERFPDATEDELSSKFNEIKASKREGYFNKAKESIQSAKDFGKGKASGQSLVDTSSNAMANQWAADNSASFFEEYDAKNPQRDGESDSEYATRRHSAFNAEKAKMKNKFANIGNDFVQKNANGDFSEPLSKQAFTKHMNQGISNIVGGNSGESLMDANANAIDHLSGTQMFDSKGKPNVAFLASGLANRKTVQMGEDFVNERMSQGVSRTEAQEDWNKNHQGSVHAGNIQAYGSSINNASSAAFSSINSDNLGSQIGKYAKAGGAFVGGFTGISSIPKHMGAISGSLEAAGQAGSATYAAGRAANSGVFGNVVKTPIQTISSSFGGAMDYLSEQQGGAVHAHSNFQNATGYAAGVLFGAKGYQVAKSMSNKVSPFRKQMQSSIASPGEVIQMARTTTDDYGNTQIADGAIRQVTTADQSYIEVTTKSGEKKVVSRMGSGHSGMRKGDVVYQDLTADGEQLVVASRNGASPTYRVDSAGARVPSQVEISQGPETLLGNPRISPVHQERNSKAYPVFSQNVDSGKFYTNDLANGFENAQVIIEKDRQFLTAEKDGITYRVSPVFSGDTRLGNETVSVPVEITEDRIIPSSYGASHVAVKSRKLVDGSNVETSEEIPYYSSKNVEGLIRNLDEIIPSKHFERASRTVEKRRQLDEVRRKQGMLG